MFYKASALKKFRKIHWKAPVLVSFFNKVRGLYFATLLKEKTEVQVFSNEFLRNI